MSVFNKQFYIDNMNKEVLFDNEKVTVGSYTKDTQYGTWGTGFKWTRTTYGYLHSISRGYSFDGGVTWDRSLRTALKVRKGKIKLNVVKDKEMSFDAIQQINRDYFGPGYRWRA